MSKNNETIDDKKNETILTDLNSKEFIVEPPPEKPKKMEDILIDDQNAKARIDKFFLQILKSRKGAESSKIPPFLNEKFKQAKQDFFKLSLNEFDLKLVNSIFSRREDDINKELEGIEFDLDFGSYEFQKKFYSKYVLMKHKDYKDESDKEAFLEVKVSLTNSNAIFITRKAMAGLLTKFRRIYDSYCKIKSFLSEKGNKKFDERFDFEIFAIIEDEVKEKLVIEENFNSFDIKWAPYEDSSILTQKNLNNSEDLIDPILNEEYLRSYLVSLFKSNMYTTIKTITGIYDLSNEKIAAIMIREHLELFEYFLKNQKVMRLSSISKKTPTFPTWKSSVKLPKVPNKKDN